MNSKEDYLALSRQETLQLYQLLKSRENDLKTPLLRILNRVEKKLYQQMTIEELEQLSTEP